MSNCGVKEFKLRELLKIYNGTKYDHLNKGDIPLYGSGGLMSHVDEALYSGEAILLPRKGTLSNIMYVNESFWTVDTMYYAVVNDKLADAFYLYSYLSQLDLSNLDSGSTLPSMTKSAYESIVVKLPDLNIQKAVANILFNLRKKLEINNQINQELEAMAKTLYDYWFVQFDFPDQNGKPYKSSGGKMVYNPELKREIPEGWGVEKLYSLLEIGRETINPMKTPKEEFKYYSIPEYDVSNSFSYELGETIKSNKFIVEKNDLLVSKLNPWFNRVVYNLEESAISSTEFIVWKTLNRFEKNFLYQVATSEGFIEYCTRFATGTSNSHKRVSPDIMVSFQIPFEKTYIQKFGEITDSIRAQVLQNNEQNQELTQLRDWLLPMLMNGQVKVE
jgi:putative hsdS